jgi:hypothetical protein
LLIVRHVSLLAESGKWAAKFLGEFFWKIADRSCSTNEYYIVCSGANSHWELDGEATIGNQFPGLGGFYSSIFF